PAFDAPRPNEPQAIASLLREFDARIDKRDRLMVIVPEIVSGLDCERIRLSRAVDWKIVRAIAQPEVAHTASPSVLTSLRHAANASGAARYLRAVVAAWKAEEADRHVVDDQWQDAAIDAQSQWLIWTDGPLSAAASA